MLKTLLRIIERRQMLFIGVTASLLTLGTLLVPETLRPGKAVLEFPCYAERMKACEMRVRAASDRGIILCPKDSLEIAIAILNSAELNCRVVPRGKRLHVTATARRVPGQIEITGSGANLRENAALADRAAMEYVHICHESEQTSVVQTRRFITRLLAVSEKKLQIASQDCGRRKFGSAGRAAEIERLQADITKYREDAGFLAGYPQVSDTPHVVTWAGYRSSYFGPWLVLAWGLLCLGLGATAACVQDRRAAKRSDP